MDPQLIMLKTAQAKAVSLGLTPTQAAIGVVEVVGAMELAKAELHKAAQSAQLIPVAAARQAKRPRGAGPSMPAHLGSLALGGMGLGAGTMLLINALSKNRRMGESLLPAITAGGVAGIGSGMLSPFIAPSLEF